MSACAIVWLFAGLMIGACLGIIIFACLVAGSRADADAERLQERKTPWPH